MSFLPSTFPNVPELPGEIPVDKKPDIFTLMKIGYTLDGSFDPDHEDFQFCCCHIHRAIKVLLILMGIVEIFGLYGWITHNNGNWAESIGAMCSFFGYLALLLGNVFWRKCHKFIKFFLILATTEIMVQLGYLITLAAFVIIFLKHESIDKDEKHKLQTEAMTYLYTAVISSLSLFFYILLFYFAYIDYKYVKGRIRSGFV
uniref:MARVEL domain-containing protein n=1 Tax=Panagrolaimus sp. JU765 TaxID=591449 RepID=A0AC34RN75_9BILA